MKRRALTLVVLLATLVWASSQGRFVLAGVFCVAIVAEAVGGRRT